MIYLSILVSIIMGITAIIHFYWSFGGQYGLKSSGPTLEGVDNFIPPRPLIFIVACLLVGLAILPMQLIWPLALFEHYIVYAGYFVSFIFIVRGIGDFKYVGVFKKVYNSNFARLDTKYFSPLIIFLGVAFSLLSLLGR